MYSIYESFGLIVKKHRKINGYSTKELADILGVSVGLVNNIENSKNDVFKLNLLCSIIEVLQIPIEEVFLERQLYRKVAFSNKKNSINLTLTDEGECCNKLTENFIINITKAFLDFITLYEEREKAAKLATEYFLYQFKLLNKLTKLEYKREM